MFTQKNKTGYTSDILMGALELMGCVMIEAINLKEEETRRKTKREEYLALTRELAEVSAQINADAKCIAVLEIERAKLYRQFKQAPRYSVTEIIVTGEYRKACDELTRLEKSLAMGKNRQDELYRKIKSFDVQSL